MIVGLTPKQWSGLCKATSTVEEMWALAQRLELDFSQEGDRFKARRHIAALIEAWAANLERILSGKPRADNVVTLATAAETT